MRILSLIIALLGLLICFNVLLSDWLDKKTKFRRELSNERGWFITMFIFFSFILVFFTKRIRQYRKNRYYQDRFNLMTRESITFTFPDIFEKVWGKEYQECMDHFRYMKIKKLQRKNRPFYKKILL